MAIQNRSHRFDNSGGIYVADGSAAQSIPTGTTYTKIDGFATDGGSHGSVTTVIASDQINITRAGIYMVNFTVSYSLDTANRTCRFAVFQDGAEIAYIHAGTKTGQVSDMQCVSASGRVIVTTTLPSIIDLRLRHDDAGSVALTPVYMNLVVSYFGDA
jgi:hypothetical protein